MKAKDIMTRALHVITSDEPVSRAALLMAREDVGILPVVDSPASMHMVGVITDRDIAVRHVGHHHTADCSVRTHMTDADLVTVGEDDHIHDVMGRMRHYQVRRIPVLNEQHRLVGIIAQADLARQVAPEEPLAFEKMMEGVSTPAVAAV